MKRCKFYYINNNGYPFFYLHQNFNSFTENCLENNQLHSLELVHRQPESLSHLIVLIIGMVLLLEVLLENVNIFWIFQISQYMHLSPATTPTKSPTASRSMSPKATKESSGFDWHCILIIVWTLILIFLAIVLSFF
jgi:hypothetical protein